MTQFGAIGQPNLYCRAPALFIRLVAQCSITCLSERQGAAPAGWLGSRGHLEIYSFYQPFRPLVAALAAGWHGGCAQHLVKTDKCLLTQGNDACARTRN